MARQCVPGRARASHALRSLSGVWLPCLGGCSFVVGGPTRPFVVIARCAGVRARCVGVSTRRASVIRPSTHLALRCAPRWRARAGPLRTDNTGATFDWSPCAGMWPFLSAQTRLARSFLCVVTRRPHVGTERHYLRTERHYVRTERHYVRTERHYVRTARLHVRTERMHVGTERTHARSERIHVPITHLCSQPKNLATEARLSRNHPISPSQDPRV